MPEEKKKPKEEGVIDFGIGKFSIGGIFNGLENLIDMAQKVAEKGEALKKEGELKGFTKGGKEVRGVYGFSIRTLGGKPIIEPFGNIKESPAGPVVEEVREPMVDVFDEKDYILVIAEMPGVEKDDIHIDIGNLVLFLKAEGKERKYKKDITLPSLVNLSTLTYSYKNGIAEIRLRKMEPSPTL